jgi:hypothetical protein
MCNKGKGKRGERENGKGEIKEAVSLSPYT